MPWCVPADDMLPELWPPVVSIITACQVMLELASASHAAQTSSLSPPKESDIGVKKGRVAMVREGG